MTKQLNISHIHVSFKNLDNAISWFNDKLNISPIYQNHKMAYVKFFDLFLILDKDETDSKITLALNSTDCDFDYKCLIKSGIASIAEPHDNSYGVRAAYLEGPGNITLEVEQVKDKQF